MHQRKKSNYILIISIILSASFILLPMHVLGEVKPITDMQDKLEGISEEEKAVLGKLFTISQEISKLNHEEAAINGEITLLQGQITDLEDKIKANQKDYELQLEVLEKVLVNYQRGGPATYLEILLKADSLSEFLKSLNIIKDISHNVGQLLTGLEERKKALTEEKSTLSGKMSQQQMKKEELKKAIDKQQELENEQETYLASLKQQSKYYTEQLGNLEQMWTDCKLLFQDMVTEITKIAGEGYFSVEDLNLNIGFTKMEGSIYEDTFNTILKKHSKLTETIFTFYDGYIVIEVLDKHLSLTGNFVIEGDSAIRFVPSKGSFYDMPLEQSSLAELFENGPLLIDFKKMAGDMLTIDFTIEAVESHDGYLSFTVKPEF